MSTTARAIYLWAKNCDERKETVQEWLDDAIVKLVAGQGKTVSSTTANGVAVTFMSNSMTIEEWVNILSDAISIINNPKLGNKKAIQVFR